MLTQSIQNHTLLSPIEKQETLNPVEEHSFFRPPLLFMFSSPSITTTVPAVWSPNQTWSAE